MKFKHSNSPTCPIRLYVKLKKCLNKNFKYFFLWKYVFRKKLYAHYTFVSMSPNICRKRYSTKYVVMAVITIFIISRQTAIQTLRTRKDFSSWKAWQYWQKINTQKNPFSFTFSYFRSKTWQWLSCSGFGLILQKGFRIKLTIFVCKHSGDI